MIKAVAPNKIRGLGRFLRFTETFQKPLFPAPKAGALNQAALRPDIDFINFSMPMTKSVATCTVSLNTFPCFCQGVIADGCRPRSYFYKDGGDGAAIIPLLLRTGCD